MSVVSAKCSGGTDDYSPMIGANRMDVVPLNFIQRLRTLVRLIWTSIFRKGSQPRATSWSAPADWGPTPIPNYPVPALGDLLRVIPIVQTESAAEIAITLISLEVYSGGFLLHGSHTEKYGAIGQGNVWFAVPVITAVDDTGAAYRWWPSGSGRGRFTPRFAPTPSPNAHQLRLTVSEIRWTFPMVHRHELDIGPWEFSIPLA